MDNQIKDLGWINEISSVTIPHSDKSVVVQQFEVTDECVERIADAVVRKLKEVEHEQDG